MYKLKWKSKLYSTVLILILLGIWQISANANIINTFLFSSPVEIIKDIYVMFSTNYVQPNIAFTMYAAFMGLIYGTVFGVIVAFVFGVNNLLSDIFEPIFIGINGLPKLALGPLFIVWFGISITSKIVMASIMVFFLVFFNAYAGFKNIDIQLVNTLKLMGATKFQVIQKVVLPSCIPWIIASLRAGVGTAVLGAIVGEYLGSTAGLGYLVQSAGGVFNITRVFACIFILMIIMSILDALVKLMGKKILRWQPQNN